MPDDHHPARAWQQHTLQTAASAWVGQAAMHGSSTDHSPLKGMYGPEHDATGIAVTKQLNTATVSASFFPAAYSQGIVLYEPFGGLCAGLEMVLRNGFRVTQYIYSDTDTAVRRIATHRMRELQSQYPALLSPTALQGSLALLPMDVRQVGSEQLLALAQQFQQQQWLVVGGWPCQDLSMAGHARGMTGSRAQLLHDVVRIIGTLQQLQPDLPPAYLLENVPFQYHKNHNIATKDFNTVSNIIGQPTLLDAAQVGSLAHRARNYWTNLCAPASLSAALRCAERPANRSVNMALPPHRRAQPVLRPDPVPQFPCNHPGQQRLAWPTLMGKNGSYAFRPGQAGSVLDHASPGQPQWTEPTAEEREFALGYLPGSTAAEGVTELDRRKALGQCMDANALQSIMAVSKAWWFRTANTAPASAQQPNSCTAATAAMNNNMLPFMP